MDEQLFWAKTLQQLGLATKPLSAKHANVKQLASRIKTILSNKSYLINAEKLASEIKDRQGVEKAVELIEKQYQSNTFY